MGSRARPRALSTTTARVARLPHAHGGDERGCRRDVRFAHARAALLRDRTIDIRRPLVMGVINATPDSFSDGGDLRTVDEAVARAVALVHDGAAVIDIGGQSAITGVPEISVREEIDRVLPVVTGLRCGERMHHLGRHLPRSCGRGGARRRCRSDQRRVGCDRPRPPGTRRAHRRRTRGDAHALAAQDSY